MARQLFPNWNAIVQLPRVKDTIVWFVSRPSGFLHFPSGTAGVVSVRILLMREGHGAVEPLTPVNGFIALDDSSWEFILEESVKKDDEILLDIYNYGQSAHTISAIITHWYKSPTQKETETKTKGRLRFVAPGRTPIQEERRNGR